jgi:hypothetical protein
MHKILLAALTATALFISAVAAAPDVSDELLKRLRAFRGRLPADFKFDRDEANAR